MTRGLIRRTNSSLAFRPTEPESAGGLAFSLRAAISVAFCRIPHLAVTAGQRPGPFRRCRRNLSAGILKNVVGRSELFEPEARLSTPVIRLVVRR